MPSTRPAVSACPQCDERTNSSVITNPRSRNDAMSRSSPRALPRSLLALAAALVLVGCEANTAPAPMADRPVQVQRVAFADADTKREFVGVVRARYETDLG